jgi:N-methylhydantoinase A/oxoprolinase/acetone carboxylase beta subunit
MAILLGIDTGGTYTDAILFDESKGVVNSAKALTTKSDLTVGIRQALEAILPPALPNIKLVSLSTTLATNAMVEGRRSPVCLLLLGYEPEALNRAGLKQALGGDPVVFLEGGHAENGKEKRALDLEAIHQAVLTYAPQVAAFAVSGFFSVRNPAHEIAVRSLVRELTGLPVTCGHELTSHLDAPRRALTTLFNARLIPLLQQLILSMQGVLTEKGIKAPLMVVKGDGSLVEAQVALERPIETILSGPAASVVGASHLSGKDNVFVADMGGTTTDIALLREGYPVLNRSGARIGGWQTMVEAIAIHTIGLGGDSEVAGGPVEGLLVGPQRVVPLSLLGHQYPQILDVLRQQLAQDSTQPLIGQFVLRQYALNGSQERLSPPQLEVWEAVSQGPIPLASWARQHELRRAAARLARRGQLIFSQFTPSDAAHVLGQQQAWSVETARLGAELWLRRLKPTGSISTGMVVDFCQQVIDQVIRQAGRALVEVALHEENIAVPEDDSPLGRLLVDRALTSATQNGAALGVQLTLRHPLVAVGAPVSTYYPSLASRLNTQLHIPPHAEVANAVGAAVGGIRHTLRVLITPLGKKKFRVHLPTGIQDFSELETAAAYATDQAGQLATEQIRRSGAQDIHLQSQRQDRTAPSNSGEKVFLESEIRVTATGRPQPG